MIKRLIFQFLLLLPLQVNAGGVCLYEISSADTRLASAGWSARAQDPSTLFTNPAGMTRLCGTQLEVGAQAIYCHFNFKPNSQTNVQGSAGKANIWLPSSSTFITHSYNERITAGIGTLGYFGSDLVYKHNWVGRYYIQKILLEGISLVPAAAFKINDQWSVGGGANIMYGFFKQRSAVRDNIDGLPDGYFNMHDYRFGYGGVFGVLYEPYCDTRLGVQYLTPVTLDFRVRPHFQNIGPKLTRILTDLGIINATIKLKVVVPQSVIFSVYHDFNET